MDLVSFLESEGYTSVVYIPGRGYCGLRRLIFTTGLYHGLNENGSLGRYCFENKSDARDALSQWDGIGDPPGNWIKHKGITSYSNPNYEK